MSQALQEFIESVSKKIPEFESLFEIPDLKRKRIKITAEVVRQRLKNIVEDVDLTRYIL